MGCGNSNSVEVKENNEQKLKSEMNFQENEYNKQNQNDGKENPLVNVGNLDNITITIIINKIITTIIIIKISKNIIITLMTKKKVNIIIIIIIKMNNNIIIVKTIIIQAIIIKKILLKQRSLIISNKGLI